MKKTITFYDLLTLMKEDKAPKQVKHDGHTYTLTEDGSDYKDRGYLSAKIGVLSMTRIYKAKCITYSESILDDVEKAYLEAVLKPFRKRVVSIVKNSCTLGVFIHVRLEDDSIDFPYFKAPMYAGMEVGKLYTAEELGLWEEDNEVD